jgi:hypothetical protein
MAFGLIRLFDYSIILYLSPVFLHLSGNYILISLFHQAYLGILGMLGLLCSSSSPNTITIYSVQRSIMRFMIILEVFRD